MDASSPTAAPGDADTRPCAHCGRPVPQRASAGRPFRYCRDNDGACQRASRNVRMRQRGAPGLAGHVARAWEVVDRLDQVVETLGEALHAELSPAGVEPQVAQVRAEAAAQIAGAQAERDEARRDAEAARTALATVRSAAEHASTARDKAVRQAYVSRAEAH
ncbi:MAG TPA: serine/threonine protein kinase, partial [Pilimelia sp.]|nr:serine/threonine protein kinase [Pilimelia sp.]